MNNPLFFRLPENVYDDAITPSPRKYSRPIDDHVYDETISPKHTAPKVPKGHTQSLKNMPTKRSDKNHPSPIVLGAGIVNSQDPIGSDGIYVLPDNFPLDYSYTSTHHLGISPNHNTLAMGQVRSQSGRGQNSSPKTVSSIYTNIDDLTSPPDRRGSSYLEIEPDLRKDPDPTYSNIDEAEDSEYVYTQGHMLVSPIRKDADQGEVVLKPQDHHVYDPIIATRPKSNTLPSTMHTYTNIQSANSPKVSSKTAATTDPELNGEASNPLYASSSLVYEGLDAANPLYVDCSKLRNKGLRQQDPSSKPLSTDRDYLSNTTDWLQHLQRKHATELQDGGRTALSQDTLSPDHTYMGILVRERVDHDYSSPKRMVSFSNESRGERGLKMQRTYSLDNSAYHRYENQAMWLPAAVKGGAKVGTQRSKAPLPLSKKNSGGGYTGLLTSGYETPYTYPNSFSTATNL